MDYIRQKSPIFCHGLLLIYLISKIWKLKDFHTCKIFCLPVFSRMYFTTLKDNILYPQLCGRSLTDVILDFVLYNLYIRKMFCLSLHNPCITQIRPNRLRNITTLICYAMVTVWLGYGYPKNGKFTQNQPGGKSWKKYLFIDFLFGPETSSDIFC